MNINEYGRKPKAGVQVDYPKEIASRTGTNAKMVEKWLADNSFDPLTILQGIGSKRINLMDFVSALLSDKGNQQFIKKYADDRADGKWSSVWKGTPKNEGKLPMTNIQKVKRMIREAVLKEALPPGAERFYVAYYATVGQHGEAGTFRDFAAALKDAVKKSKDSEFMDGLEYLGVEPTHNGQEFAIIYIDETYMKHINSDQNFASSEDKNIFMTVAKKVLQTGKPAKGKFNG